MTLSFTNPAALMAYNNMLAQGGMGQPMSMADAVVAQERQRDQQRSAQLQTVLPTLLQQVDLSDINGSLSKMVQAGIDPKNAMAVIELKQKGEQEKRLQEQAKQQNAVMKQIGGLLSGDAAGIPTAPTEPTTASAPGFETALNNVLQTEGGYVADDGGKGPTNMGINSTANPDVDVKALDKEKAAKLYKERYWDAIGADKLPPATAAVAFDAAVNHGPAKAKELLDASGGDPQKLIALRRQEYQRLVEADPAKYGQYAAGWEDRLKRLEAGIGGKWGLRQDGTQKGDGFLGPLKRPDGKVSTELSIGVNVGGKEMDVPSLVPTLTKDEVNALLNMPDGEGLSSLPENMSRSIVEKARAHAEARLAEGKSPFAQPGESPASQPTRSTPDPSKLAQAGAMMAAAGIEGGNTLLQLANFQQGQQNRAEDKQSDNSKTQFDQEGKLYDKFVAQTKEHVVVRDAFQNMQTAYEESKAGNPAGDIQMVYAFMKSQDPNSSVREGEYATAENSGGIQAKVRVMYNKLLDGERLSPDQRDNFLRIGEANWTKTKKQFDKLSGQFQKRAEAYKLDPSRVTFDLSVAEPDAQPQPTIPAGTPARVVQSKAEYDALPKGSRYLAPDGQVRVKQ